MRAAVTHFFDAFLRALDPRRRYSCQHQTSPRWDERADAAVALLASRRPVASTGPLRIGDFGAGNERLRLALTRNLPVRFEYRPYDLHPQTRTVHQIDLRGELPARMFDVVFCLGLLEYLDNLDVFAARLGAVCQRALVSYVITDASRSLPPSERRKRGWLSDLSRSECEAIFTRNGYTLEAFELTNDGNTGLWLWTSPSRNATDERS